MLCCLAGKAVNAESALRVNFADANQTPNFSLCALLLAPAVASVDAILPPLYSFLSRGCSCSRFFAVVARPDLLTSTVRRTASRPPTAALS